MDSWNMRFLDLTMPTLEENLALDEALLLDAEAGGEETLRVWSWPHLAVVLGAAGRLDDDVHEDVCTRDRIPLARRSSGGGTVLLGSGCLLYSLILRFDRAPEFADLRASYREILGRLQRALMPQAVPITLEGSSDLAWQGRKFSGNAQQRKRTHLLHHGTLLHAFDLALIARYLKPPPRQPEYRQGRSHAEFLCNLPMREDKLIAMLQSAWCPTGTHATIPHEQVRQLVDEKYATESWTRRR
jgi:lipoate-protein ligase A